VRPEDIARAARLAGLELPDDLEFEVSGDEPVLPSPHRLATGAATARILTGVGANALWRARTGRVQTLTVDARHAAAALLSFLHLRFDDPAAAPGSDPRRPAARLLTEIFPTADGRFVQLHGSFTDAPSVCDELGVGEDPSADELGAAVLRRRSQELEDALVRRGVCGGVVRTHEEWAAGPQGAATGALPAVRITRIGDAPPTPPPPGDRPASGLRVLDLTQVLAGPTCAKTLAEHGADVLHVTHPRGQGIPLFDLDTGIGKRQISLDLDEADDTETLRELLVGADVFSQGYRQGAMERLGFGVDAVVRTRPGIVYVSENCYGPIGPWAARPGWEQLAQAATGMSHREGAETPGGAPRLAPAAANDYATGWLAAYGTMLALARRAVEGGSWLVECSLSQTSAWYQRLGDDNDPARADPGDPAQFTAELDAPGLGRFRYLRPALSMSETEPRFDLPPSRSGSDEARWLRR
jgi:crotonobetainyl-CoA:carnitine CoA-transferase CaiB-like acyl-CoA transferase